jgi:hypothetical protein
MMGQVCPSRYGRPSRKAAFSVKKKQEICVGHPCVCHWHHFGDFLNGKNSTGKANNDFFVTNPENHVGSNVNFSLLT